VFAGQMLAYGQNGALYAATSDQWQLVATPSGLPSQTTMDTKESGLYVKEVGGPHDPTQPDIYILNPNMVPDPSDIEQSTLFRVYSGPGRLPVFPAPVYAYPPGGRTMPTGAVYYCPSGNWIRASGITEIPTFSSMENASAGLAWARDLSGIQQIIVNVACYVLDLNQIPYASGEAFFTTNYAYGGTGS
jgi:hypothetical protein